MVHITKHSIHTLFIVYNYIKYKDEEHLLENVQYMFDAGIEFKFQFELNPRINSLQQIQKYILSNVKYSNGEITHKRKSVPANVLLP